MKKKSIVCRLCRGKGSVKAQGSTHVENKDTKKLLKIMKKNNFKQGQLGKVIGISQSAISNVLRTGVVPKKYFQILKEKGLT